MIRSTYSIKILIGILSLSMFIHCGDDDGTGLTGTVTGSILDSESNEPISDARINLSDPVDASIFSSNDGTYRFSDVPGHDGYVLTVTHPDFESNSQTFDLRNGETKDIPILLEAIPPVLQVITPILDYGDNLGIRSLEFQNIGRGVLTWSLVDSESWIELGQSAGSTTSGISSVLVSIDRSELTQGAHSSQIEITSNGGPATFVEVKVFVNSKLEVDPTDLDFNTTSTNKSFAIRNTDSGTINYAVVPNADWLSVDIESGSVSNETDPVSVTVDRTGLAAGSYSAKIFVNSPEGREEVSVKMEVQ